MGNGKSEYGTVFVNGEWETVNMGLCYNINDKQCDNENGKIIAMTAVM